MHSSYEQQAYPAVRSRGQRKSRVGEVFAALFLLGSILLLVVTGARAMQFRSIVERGRASELIEYHPEEIVSEVETLPQVTTVPVNKFIGK